MDVRRRQSGDAFEPECEPRESEPPMSGNGAKLIAQLLHLDADMAALRQELKVATQRLAQENGDDMKLPLIANRTAADAVDAFLREPKITYQ